MSRVSPDAKNQQEKGGEMNTTVKALRSFSNQKLQEELAYTTKNGDHYPKSYLDKVNKEIKRRSK